MTMTGFPTVRQAELEHWLRDRYFAAELDLGSSGVEVFSMAEVRQLTGLTSEELDAISFTDSHSLGGPSLRAAVAERWAGGDAGRVMMTHGSSEALFLILNALLDPNDEVVVLDPAYHSLSALAASLAARVKPLRLRRERDFALDLDELRDLCTPAVRVVVLNFPHNPTGTTLTPQQLTEVIDIVARTGTYLVWDGAFSELVYGAPPLPEPTLLYERAISVGTLSKGYGLPGLRVGWCLGPPAILAQCLHLRDYTTLSLSPIVERIAERVIRSGDRFLGPRLEQARRNRAHLADWCRQQVGLLEMVSAQGGVTVFPFIPAPLNVYRFCAALAEAGLLLVPGSCFGYPRHFRLGFGGPTAQFTEGLIRLSHALRNQEAVWNARI